MVDSYLGSHNSIEWYQQLQNIIVSINQQLKIMNNAWKLKHDYGKVQEKCDVVLPILEVWRSGFDCKCFLDVLAMF